jgi:hypothetical protein
VEDVSDIVVMETRWWVDTAIFILLVRIILWVRYAWLFRKFR